VHHRPSLNHYSMKRWRNQAVRRQPRLSFWKASASGKPSRRGRFSDMGAAGLTCAAVRPAGAPLAPWACAKCCAISRARREGHPGGGPLFLPRDGRWMTSRRATRPRRRPGIVAARKQCGRPHAAARLRIDAVVLKRKRIEMERRTSLGKFRFGTRITTAGRSSMAAWKRAKRRR